VELPMDIVLEITSKNMNGGYEWWMELIDVDHFHVIGKAQLNVMIL
jgi:hypothetical protein